MYVQWLPGSSVPSLKSSKSKTPPVRYQWERYGPIPIICRLSGTRQVRPRLKHLRTSECMKARLGQVHGTFVLYGEPAEG